MTRVLGRRARLKFMPVLALGAQRYCAHAGVEMRPARHSACFVSKANHKARTGFASAPLGPGSGTAEGPRQAPDSGTHPVDVLTVDLVERGRLVPGHLPQSVRQQGGVQGAHHRLPRNAVAVLRGT